MDNISYDDFVKSDIRVGIITGANSINKSEKLLHLQVNLGPEIGSRFIVAGIAKSYSIDELINKRILVVVNMVPRKMMGIESHGMLLAAQKVDGTVVLATCPDVEPGSQLG
jgi:methionyl-tRNA synthetase